MLRASIGPAQRFGSAPAFTAYIGLTPRAPETDETCSLNDDPGAVFRRSYSEFPPAPTEAPLRQSVPSPQEGRLCSSTTPTTPTAKRTCRPSAPPKGRRTRVSGTRTALCSSGPTRTSRRSGCCSTSSAGPPRAHTRRRSSPGPSPSRRFPTRGSTGPWSSAATAAPTTGRRSRRRRCWIRSPVWARSRSWSSNGVRSTTPTTPTTPASSRRRWSRRSWPGTTPC